MKTSVILLTSLCSMNLYAQGTAFTYQGRLNANGAPANGAYDLTFARFENPTGGGALLGPITNSAVSVSNGLFTTVLDFGPYNADAYGRGRWLGISVRTNGSGPLAILGPRQPMTPAPSAIYASYAGGPPPGGGFNADLLDGFDSAAFWQIGGNSGTFAGVNFLGTTDNQPLELKVNGLRALRLEPTVDTVSYSTIVNVIGGSAANFVASGVIGATIGGGGGVNYLGTPGTNRVSRHFGTIGGGFQNTISGDFATIGGGRGNSILANSGYATIAGGHDNAMDPNAHHSVIGGGSDNFIAGQYATIPGGYFNYALGNYTFAAGSGARAYYPGSFVWADSQGGTFGSTADNQFCIRAAGGVQLNTDTSVFFGNQTRQMLNLWGTAYGIGVQNSAAYFRSDQEFMWYRRGSHSDTFGDPGAGGTLLMRLGINGELIVTASVTAPSFVQSSDRNAKENFEPINSREVLEKVAALPITRWNFKQDRTSEHIGPMAQDFYAAFGTGSDDKHITTVDADGVALAAIQGLNQKVELRGKKSEDRIQKLEAENAELKQRLEKLEHLMENAANR